ncbi:MAG: amidohydrolase family protein [Candidatus Marsarchaeota archaeon]|nr:amidohydrolase family protein [Candidatus Marsarchaeota archaeon]
MTISSVSRSQDVFKITDPHVHSGVDFFGPSGDKEIISDVNKYSRHAKLLGINKAVLIPEPTHKLKLMDGTIEVSCIWQTNTNRPEMVEFKRILRKGDSVLEEKNPKQPYTNVNSAVLKEVKDRNAASNTIKFFFAPLLHPHLDNQDNLIRFMTDKNVKAIKIHGPSSYSSPNSIPLWVISMAKDFDVPFIIHTDSLYELAEVSNSRMKALLQKNLSINWAKWVVKNNVRAYLAHGAGLDKEATKIVNDNDNIIIGVGPDAVINSEINMQEKHKEYLPALFSMVDPGKIVFSTDFAWNWISYNKSNLDWGTKKRLLHLFDKENYDRATIEGVFQKNADRFFKL